MTDFGSVAYDQRRERQERERAERATNPAVVSVHRDLASRYSQLIDGSGNRPTFFR